MAMDLGAISAKIEASGGGEGTALEARKRSESPLMCVEMKKARKDRASTTAKERISRMTPCAAGKRSSIYRGVTRHRWTGRYEAHLWDKSTWNQNQNKKGKQVYLGAYDDEEAAARAYDLAALKYWGAGTLINFPVSDYARDLEEMQMVSKEDYLVSLRRKSSAFSRGFPKYRGLSRQPQNNRWETPFGQMQNDLFANCSTSSDAASEGKCAGGYVIERKCDLTGYIRWWTPKKTRQTETGSAADDVARELRILESSYQPSEPYQLPSLGLPARANASQGLSVCDILSQSEAFKNFLHKASKSSETKDVSCQKGKDLEAMPFLFPGCGLNLSGVNLPLNELPVAQTSYQFTPILSAPLTPTYMVDPVPETINGQALFQLDQLSQQHLGRMK